MSELSSFDRWYSPRFIKSDQVNYIDKFFRYIKYRSKWQYKQQLKELNMVQNYLDTFSKLSDDDLELEFIKCKNHFKKDFSSIKIRTKVLPIRAKALAILSIYIYKTLGLKPHWTQQLAALSMHQGTVVQMAPGEGKTLALGLVSVLYGWNKAPCHVVTANDYLAQRDALYLEPFYKICGLSVSSVHGDLTQEQLRECYLKDIVYATGNQLLADFLRDELLMSGLNSPVQRHLKNLRNSDNKKPVMRGIYTVIVDEADSVLVDESNTPLVISTTDYNPRLLEVIPFVDNLVRHFIEDKHYIVQKATLSVIFSQEGEELLENLSEQLPPFWRTENRRVEIVSKAILARDIFKRDSHYVIEDDKIVIIDENTGRKMYGRSWSYGLHQAIEAKEKLPLSNPTKVMARRSFQAFFQSYHRICGASGTLQGIDQELWSNYELSIVNIPPRVTTRLKIEPFKYLNTFEDKLKLVCNDVITLNKLGIPVLIGTRKIADSEIVANYLETLGINCLVLNAKEDKSEAKIIENAGQIGSVTVATNMAGRGVDIKIPEEVIKIGGLHVLMFEPHETKRVDWQLFGRAGRQGAPGKATMYLAKDDDLLKTHLPWFMKWLQKVSTIAAIRFAQENAQYKLRKQRNQLLKRDKLLNDQLTFTTQLKT